MKTLIKNIFTFQGSALRDFIPENSSNFHTGIHMTLGPEQQEGGHDYSLYVCTPTWLDHSIENKGPIWGRHLLLVNYFDEKQIRTSIENIITKCERSDWVETSAVLARFFAWEFEDYQV